MDVGKRDGRNFIEHSGEVSGFVSENIVFPDDHAAIVVLTNEMATNAASLIARRIAPTVLGLPAAAPTKDEAQALAIFNGLADGRIDRTLFTEFCNAYFSQQTLEDFASSLKPLGPPLTFKQTTQEARGGMVFRAFTVTFPDRDLKVTTYQMPDGKYEQYLSNPLNPQVKASRSELKRKELPPRKNCRGKGRNFRRTKTAEVKDGCPMFA